MVLKKPKFSRRLQNIWTKAVKKLYRQRSLILAVLLFFLSMGIAPVIAKVPVSTTITQNQQSSSQLVQQGRKLYEAGQFEKAATVWQQAATAYASKGDKLNQAMALSNFSASLQQLGQWDKANQTITESLNILKTQENTPERSRILAQTLDIQGQLQLAVGQAEDAINTWQQATDIYTRISNQDGAAKSQINQSFALQNLGLYPKACQTLLQTLELDNQECEVSNEDLQTLKNKPSSQLQVLAMRSLGDVLQVIGKTEQSQKVLEETLKLAQQLNSLQDISAVYLSLGNTTRALANRAGLRRVQASEYRQSGLNYYAQAAKLSTSATTRLLAQLNQLSLLIESQKFSEAEALWLSLKPQINSLPADRTGVYAQINLAQSLLKLASRGTTLAPNSQISNFNEIDQILTTAVDRAKSLGDERAYAYALSNRARLYEENQQWEEAENLTQQALNLVPTFKAADITYQLYWQLGRIRNARGDTKGAITNYTQAVEILQSLRRDLVAISSEVQFSFRESVEPVYRELVGLLLPSPSIGNKQAVEVEQSDLKQARDVIESLQLAELDNFFQDACLDAKPVQIDSVDPTAAVFYTIILRDRLEVIAALPGKPLRHYATVLSQEKIEETLNQLRRSVTDSTEEFSLQPSQQVYEWVIRPIELELASSGVKTLVFVLDGALRNIPMAALHDGKQYLAQKNYNVVLTPGLQLLDPQPLARQEFQTLTAGLTEPRQGFSALPNVELELKRIDDVVSTELLLNESFTEANFQTTVNSFPYPVVHLATHGEFSSQAENTFILTWDEKINAKELDSLLRADTRLTRPIELLVLSACRTAVGDNRAALGLAGVAVRAGARSTLASLWYVSDEATSLLMTRFYEELAKNQVTKAEALRLAQQSVLQNNEFSHPYFWAAFVLVGNWL